MHAGELVASGKQEVNSQYAASTVVTPQRALQDTAFSAHSLDITVPHISAPLTQPGSSMSMSWSRPDMGLFDRRQLSPDSMRVRSGAVGRQTWEAGNSGSEAQGSGSVSVRTAESTTVAAQQCQLPPTPTCNISAAVQVWEEAMEGMDLLDRVLFLSCETFTQVGETANVRYPPGEPGTAPKSPSIGGVSIDEVCKLSFTVPAPGFPKWATAYEQANRV